MFGLFGFENQIIGRSFHELCLVSDAVFDSRVLKKRVDFAKNRRWRGIFTIVCIMYNYLIMYVVRR
jgi:hypothetical protein